MFSDDHYDNPDIQNEHSLQFGDFDIRTGVFQSRAHQDAVFFDSDTGIGALLDGHGYLPGWDSRVGVKHYWKQSKELNEWMFERVKEFFKACDLTEKNIINFRSWLLTNDYYNQNFKRYGVSAVIIKIVGSTIHIFQHGDCFVYISTNSTISLLPRYGVEDERFTRFQVFGQYAKNTFKNLTREYKLQLDRIFTGNGEGGLNVSRTLGDQMYINNNKTNHSILFPEHALDVSTIDDPDWILITSDGLVNLLETNHFESFLRDNQDAPKDDNEMRQFINKNGLRYLYDDASYLLIKDKQPKPHIKHVDPGQRPFPLMILATTLMI